ncbi:PASTA domain-containing protein [Prevotella sp. A2931]|uniref:PASTA domain-containing protein n=1 Tax=Prevotella illustrans TaxID=2800387 RepID=A0ABS3M8K3_9BACT|nr:MULTISPECIES: PASTA domain-containing protein [Prevotella]MBO1364445.1 PASTA domain-containing protein [Prevotella illustrans]PTL26576.1 penicillin-binding protein [Prevotella sp. oral taxon 820]
MKSSEFINKFKSRYLWGNILAMVVVIAGIIIGVKYGLDLYTHHGEAIEIPNLKHMKFADAQRILKDRGLEIVVSDTGYVKNLPADCVLEQNPVSGSKVKSGHIIYVTINSTLSPTLSLPDIIDNSSLREAMAKLTAMGFKLASPEFIPGEKDWVYGIIVRGRHVMAGQRIPIEDSLVIQVGNGMRNSEDDINYIDPAESEQQTDEDEVDEFDVVTAPEAPEKEHKPETPQKPANP